VNRLAFSAFIFRVEARPKRWIGMAAVDCGTAEENIQVSIYDKYMNLNSTGIYCTEMSGH
jgi:hypothetical protein